MAVLRTLSVYVGRMRKCNFLRTRWEILFYSSTRLMIKGVVLSQLPTVIYQKYTIRVKGCMVMKLRNEREYRGRADGWFTSLSKCEYGNAAVSARQISKAGKKLARKTVFTWTAKGIHDIFYVYLHTVNQIYQKTNIYCWPIILLEKTVIRE